MENTTKEGNEFEPSINEPHEEVPVVDEEQLRALPENEEEKEEILLPSTTAAKTTKPKVSSSKSKSPSRKRRLDEISSADTTKQLERQATQLDKITIMLHSIQKDMKSTKGQSKLINQLQSQIKQLRAQMSLIQKNIGKRNFTTATISSRKKIRPKKR
jgi:U3 small nucleolar ribonucleoprotein component